MCPYRPINRRLPTIRKIPDDLWDEISSGSSFTVGPIKPQPIELRVRAGEILRLYKNNGILGHKATAHKPAGITCTLPEVLQRVHTRQRVFIDDGKIGAIVTSSNHSDYVELEIISPVDSASKI